MRARFELDGIAHGRPPRRGWRGARRRRATELKLQGVKRNIYLGSHVLPGSHTAAQHSLLGTFKAPNTVNTTMSPMSHKPLCCQRRQRTPTSHHTPPGHRPSSIDAVMPQTPSERHHTTAPSCHLHGCHQRYCATQTVTAACCRDADTMTHAVPTLTDAVATLSPHPAARRCRRTLAAPPLHHTDAVATPSPSHRASMPMESPHHLVDVATPLLSTPSPHRLTSPCCRHAITDMPCCQVASALSPHYLHAVTTPV